MYVHKTSSYDFWYIKNHQCCEECLKMNTELTENLGNVTYDDVLFIIIVWYFVKCSKWNICKKSKDVGNVSA